MSQFQSVNANSLRNDNDPPPIALSSLPNRSLQTEAIFLGGWQPQEYDSRLRGLYGLGGYDNRWAF